MVAIFFADKKPTEALNYLKKAREANPDYLVPYFNLAAYYAIKGDYEKSLDEYREVLKRAPKNTMALTNMATILELKGKNDEVIKKNYYYFSHYLLDE